MELACLNSSGLLWPNTCAVILCIVGCKSAQTFLINAFSGNQTLNRAPPCSMKKWCIPLKHS